jgi:hypothetical protein
VSPCTLRVPRRHSRFTREQETQGSTVPRLFGDGD